LTTSDSATSDCGAIEPPPPTPVELRPFPALRRSEKAAAPVGASKWIKSGVRPSPWRINTQRAAASAGGTSVAVAKM
jgi:hypothetical protein